MTEAGRRAPGSGEGCPMDRRSALRTMAAGALAAPAVLRGRYPLFARSRQEYTARAIRLVTGNFIRVLTELWS